MLTSRIHSLLHQIYPADQIENLAASLVARMERAPRRPADELPSGEVPAFTERDVVLISYGDQIWEAGRPPLQTLANVLGDRIGDVINALHVLPFYPWTSDDGFSVVDYRAVDPKLGGWEDIQALGRKFRMMFDAVINHISAESEWFQRFQRDEEPFTRYFIVMDPSTDLSQVVRPRTLPLLTPVETAHGTEHVWTTFSPDQVDLNYAEPELLLEIVDVLLGYVEQGADLIRLDAIAFLWKEVGTSSIHLPQTHAVIQLFRAILDVVAPRTVLVTETNVPHTENVSYFGDGTNEAQMVYNFTLPPLTLHTFAQGDATRLQQWASTLSTPSPTTTFFNFLASHDGIGVRPVEGILTPDEIDALCRRSEAHGGFVSYRSSPDGRQLPYELNVTYFDALNHPNGDEPRQLQLDRFIASQAILLAMAGVPGIYVHSLFGSRNWRKGAEASGRHRTINREKLERSQLEAELDDKSHLRAAVLDRYRALLKARIEEPAFHPNGMQRVLPVAPGHFTLLRRSPDEQNEVCCIHSVSDRPQQVRFDADILAPAPLWRDLISGRRFATPGELTLDLPAYQVLWLKREV